MACPVVVTPEVGLAAVVAEAECGRVIAGEPLSLAGTINALLGNQELRRSMGARGLETVNRQFLWRGIARQMERVYAAVS